MSESLYEVAFVLVATTIFFLPLIMGYHVIRGKIFTCSVDKTVIVWGDEPSVFRYLADFSNTAEWDPCVSDAKRLTPIYPEPALGDAFEVTSIFRGHPSKMTYCVTRIVPNSQIWLTGESDVAIANDSITLHQDWPSGATQRTRVEYRLDVQLKGWLKPFAWLLGRELEQMAKKSIGGLKIACARHFSPKRA